MKRSNIFKSLFLVGLLSFWTLNGWAQGGSCADPIELATTGVYDVDYTNGDQWYSFTAPKSGDAVITTGYYSHAGTNGELNFATGDVAFTHKDTKIEIYTVCGDPFWLSNTNYNGLLGGSEINPVVQGLAFEAGVEYLINMVDDPDGIENQKGGQSSFEFFYWEDLIIGTEAVPLDVTLGLNEDFATLYYPSEQWFTYTFPANGTFSIVFEEQYDGSNTVITSNDAITKTQWNDDSDEPFNGFTYTADAGDIVTYKLSNKNNTFTASFEEIIICQTPFDLNGLVNPDGLGKNFAVDMNAGNQFFQYTAPQDGDFKISSCNGGVNTYLLVLDENCNLVDTRSYEAGLCFGGTEYVVSMSEAQTLNLAWDDRYMLEGQKTFTGRAYFQPYQLGDTPETALPIMEGNNSVTRMFTDQYLSYTAPSYGVLTIQNCIAGNWVTGSNYTLYASGDQETPIAENIYCSVDEEEGLIQSSIEYTVIPGEQVILKSDYIYDWNDGHDFTLSFEEDLCQGEYTQLDDGDLGDDLIVDNTIGNHVFRYTATMNGTLFLSSCNQADVADTYVKLYELCSEIILAESDNFCGVESRMSYAVTSGTTYEIVWDDVNIAEETGTKSFEFYFDYLENIPGKTQEDAILTNDDIYVTHTQYIEEQWYSYILPDNGILNVGGAPEPDPEVENLNTVLLITENGGFIDLLDPHNATYTGMAGDEVYIVWNSNFGYQGIEFELFFTTDNPCADTNIVTETACGSYQFGEDLLTISGQYIGDYVNQAACDSLVILNLTINASTESIINKTACDEYDFLGTLLSATGTYNETLINTVGCDSLVTLNLTINESTTATLIKTACYEYDFLGTLLTATGTYNETLTNAVGCDSLVTLNLTINESTTATLTKTTCDEYDFLGTLLTTSGTYNETLTNAAGCDSLVTLNLTILESTESTILETTCTDYDFLGDVLTVSGDYQKVLKNASGCDSLVNLTLTILEPNDLKCQDVVAGLAEEFNSNISLYPSPTRGDITVDLGKEFKNVTVTTYSAMGQNIKREQFTSSNKISTFINAPTGLYYIHVSADELVEKTFRVTKE